MRFEKTAIDGVWEVVSDWHHDERGAFGRTFCAAEFAAHGLFSVPVQCNISTNAKCGTLRGFHLQAVPHAEAKLVQCVTGSLFDVALDLRPESKTFGKHHSVMLSADSGRMLLVPEGCAHAFQTLQDATSLIYYCSAFYEPASAGGVLWNDPALDLVWPIKDAIVSARDRQLPRLEDFKNLA